MIEQEQQNFLHAKTLYKNHQITREEYAKVHGAWLETCRKLPSHLCKQCPIGGCPCCIHDVVMVADEPICKRCDKETLDKVFKNIKYEEHYFTKGSYKPYIDFPAHKLRAEKIIKMANPKSVLDVGCAYGYVVRHLVDMVIDAYGIDISRWCEKQANEIIPGRFKRASADNIPFADKSFDLLYSEGILEHIPEENIPKVMFEFDRLARQRILQISFDNETWAAGHINIHPIAWWYDRVPDNTWIYADIGAIDEGKMWVYKG